MKHVHFIGIGGTGLSAMALLLLENGIEVSGSDRQLSPLARQVQAAGGQVFVGHRAEQVLGADLVVRSSAIPNNNVELRAARQAGIPVYKRADFLDELIAGRQVLAVAGTHGKTTTTAMLAWLLSALGQDPSYIIGGVALNLASNAHAGEGPYFVIEADEYDRMFLGLRPQLALVTNVEYDHPDCYPTPQDFFQAFVAFVERLEPAGSLLVCSDDPGAERLALLAERLGHRVRRYGLGEAAQYRARDLVPAEGGYRFELDGAFATASSLRLRLPGEHNVRNALAALAALQELGLPLDKATFALQDFRGVGRRFELRGKAAGVTVVDDYGHHPTEIQATLAAARSRFAGRPIWAVWQPHTYSRTRALLDRFARAFADADHVLVTEVYPAREAPPKDGFGGQQAAQVLQHSDVRFAPNLEDARRELLAHLRSGDVLLVFSAGDADQLSGQVLAALQESSTTALQERRATPGALLGREQDG
jgi:UDP-N-acetylmuramate--alanine ligase